VKSDPPDPVANRAMARDLAIMQDSRRWPFRVVLPLAHRTRLDQDHFPLCAVLAVGHRTRVFFAELGSFTRAELQSQKAFDTALKRFQSVSYVSFAAILKEWRID
jgi:hypothetical protein